jgi:DNA-binding CsgD family transcriptional regulator
VPDRRRHGKQALRDSVNTPADDAEPRLTEGETDVLRLVAKELTARQIAERLVLSHRKVENHVQSTLRKLQLHNRVELAGTRSSTVSTRRGLLQGRTAKPADQSLVGRRSRRRPALTAARSCR